MKKAYEKYEMTNEEKKYADPPLGVEELRGDRLNSELPLCLKRSIEPDDEDDIMRKYNARHRPLNTSVSDDPEVLVPNHYARFPIEPITFIMKNKLPYYAGNAIKYTCRAGHKLYEGCDAKESKRKDLEKAMRCLEMELNRMNGGEVL